MSYNQSTNNIYKVTLFFLKTKSDYKLNWKLRVKLTIGGDVSLSCAINTWLIPVSKSYT